MIIQNASRATAQVIAKELSEDKTFTGEITVTFHCKDGGIAKAQSTVKKELKE